MSRSQREKGKRTERQAAEQLRDTFGIPARRSVQYCGRAGDADLQTVPGLHVEVKARKSIAALRFHEQATADAVDGDMPIVLMKEDRSDFYVLIRLQDFPAVAELLGGTKK